MHLISEFSCQHFSNAICRSIVTGRFAGGWLLRRWRGTKDVGMCSLCQRRFFHGWQLIRRSVHIYLWLLLLNATFSRAQVLKPFVSCSDTLQLFYYSSRSITFSLRQLKMEQRLSLLIAGYLTIWKLDRKAWRHSLNLSHRASRDLNHDASSITHLFLPVRRL